MDRRTYTLDEMPDWLARACESLPPFVTLDDWLAMPVDAREAYDASKKIRARPPYERPDDAGIEVRCRPAENPKIAGMRVSLANWADLKQDSLTDFGDLAQRALLTAKPTRMKANIEWLPVFKYYGFFLVTDHFKIVVQRLAPDDLKFEKVRYASASPNQETPLWFAWPDNAVDAVDLDRSSLNWQSNGPEQFVCDCILAGCPVFDPDRQAGRKIFQDVSLPNKVFATSEFQSELRDAGINDEHLHQLLYSY